MKYPRSPKNTGEKGERQERSEPSEKERFGRFLRADAEPGRFVASAKLRNRADKGSFLLRADDWPRILLTPRSSVCPRMFDAAGKDNSDDRFVVARLSSGMSENRLTN